MQPRSAGQGDEVGLHEMIRELHADLVAHQAVPLPNSLVIAMTAHIVQDDADQAILDELLRGGTYADASACVDLSERQIKRRVAMMMARAGVRGLLPLGFALGRVGYATHSDN